MKKIYSMLLALACVSAAFAQLKAARFQFELRDVDGTVHRETELASRRALVVFFTTVDCPVSNSYVPEMNRISKEYASRSVSVFAVEADTTLAAADVRRHAHEFQFGFPVLLDPRQYFVRRAGATATPEVAVFSNAGELLYLGRIDNRVEDFGTHRNVVTEHDLRDALELILAGKSVPHRETKIVGCAINYVKS